MRGADGEGEGVEVEPKCVFLCVRVFLLCGQDGSARRRAADGCLGCENTLSRRTAGRQQAGRHSSATKRGSPG